MYGRRREGKGGAGLFDDASYLIVDLLPDLEVLKLVGGHGEVHDVYVLARIAKLFESDRDDGVVDLVTCFEVRPYIAAHLLKLFSRCVVGEADRELHRLAELGAGVVRNGLFHEGGVRDGDHEVVPGAYAGGAHGNVLDEAFCGGGADVVPHVEGLVCDDLKPGEQVARRVLRRQGQGQTGKAETGDDAVDVVAHFRDEDDREKGHDDNAQDDGHEADRHFGGRALFVLVEPDDLPGGGRRIVQKHPGDERNVHHAEELVNERHPLRLGRDDEERELHAEDNEEDPERVA